MRGMLSPRRHHSDANGRVYCGDDLDGTTTTILNRVTCEPCIRITEHLPDLLAMRDVLQGLDGDYSSMRAYSAQRERLLTLPGGEAILMAFHDVAMVMRHDATTTEPAG